MKKLILVGFLILVACSPTGNVVFERRECMVDDDGVWSGFGLSCVTNEDCHNFFKKNIESVYPQVFNILECRPSSIIRIKASDGSFLTCKTKRDCGVELLEQAVRKQDPDTEYGPIFDSLRSSVKCRRGLCEAPEGAARLIEINYAEFS